MVNPAKSDELKRQIARQEKDNLMSQAIELFHTNPYAEAVGVWKVREMDRKEQNDALKAEWARDVKKCEVEKNRAKCERQKPRWTKPKMPPTEKAAPKPKVADFAEGSDEDEEMDEDEDEDGEGMGSSDGGGDSD